MKLTKMVGLAAITALAAMAFVSATTASADSLCLNNEKKCAAPYTGSVWGLSAEAVLVASGLETKCESATLADFVKSEGPNLGLLLLVLTLTFTNCKGACKSAKAQDLPYSAFALRSKNHAVFSQDGNGAPAALLECTLFGIPVNCKYEATGGSALLSYVESGPSLVAKVPLTRNGDSGACPASGEWRATYKVFEDNGGTEGAPLFLTAEP